MSYMPLATSDWAKAVITNYRIRQEHSGGVLNNVGVLKVKAALLIRRTHIDCNRESQLRRSYRPQQEMK